MQPVTLAAAQRPDGRERALLVVGVTSGSAADKAGFAPGQKITALNGRVFTPELLTQALLTNALSANTGATTPIQVSAS